MLRLTTIAAGLAALALASAAHAQTPPKTIAGAACGALPAGVQNNATEPKSGRKFFLEFPCLKAGEKVTVILNLHGAGSSGSYQHRYFPAADYMDKYKLVVITPTAATAAPTRMWVAQADDQYLHDLADLVTGALGQKNVRGFWLAGHSQGGITSARIVCSAYFKDKVDGFLSLSGGRQGGQAQLSGNFNRAKQMPAGQKADPAVLPPAGPRPPAPASTAPPAADGPTTCDYSHIFDIGQYEIEAMPEASAIADKFGCKTRVERDVVDDKPGFVYDPGQQNPATLGWGRTARPGTAKMFVWQDCKDKRVVADVMRMDKGHTEGLEPRVSEEIVKLITSAKGGKISG
ncbi:hypothetical protein BH11PSE2_BH11PSE2_17160 [soil metagenome]